MNAILDCVKNAKITSSKEIEQASTKIQEIETVIQAASERAKSLFGLEKNSGPAIKAEIERLKGEKARLSCLTQFGNLPCLSLDFLKWRDKNGFPKIALLNLNSPTVRFSYTGAEKWNDNIAEYQTSWSASCVPTYDKPIRQAYSDVFDALRKVSKEEKKSVHLKTEFTGVIPETTRAKILEAQKSFKDVMIAAEANNWKLETGKIPIVKPRPVDPLVLGWDGQNFWIVDHFDMTPVEKYIKEEFTL